MYGDTHKKCRIQEKPLSVRSKLNGTHQLQIRDTKLQSLFGYRWVLALRDTEVSCSISGPPDKALCENCTSCWFTIFFHQEQKIIIGPN